MSQDGLAWCKCTLEGHCQCHTHFFARQQSFFCFFEENHDAFDIAEHLEQVYQEALDVYAQVGPIMTEMHDEECSSCDEHH